VESPDLPLGKKFTARWYGKLTVYTAVVLAFTAVCFIFIPRPFLVIPGLRAAMAHAGGLAQLEQRITYRDMTGMAGRNRIAFKVQVEQGELPPNPYWRGRVLDRFDGQAWSESGRMRGMGRIIRALPWETLDYRFIPYRLQSRIIYVNGLPVSAMGRLDRPLYISSAGEVVVDSPFLFSDSYQISTVDRPMPAFYRPEPFTTDTTGVTPRIDKLAKDWSARLVSLRDKAGAITSRLRSDYRYRLQAPSPPEGANPVEYFLFESRTGNCEHFAGALCLLLRAAGIPSRVVEGFAGAEKTDIPDEFVVRFARAHAWVEALLEPSYWTPLDATPAVGADLGENRLWRFLVDSYDDLEHLWIKQVVYFDRADQVTIFRALRRLVSGEITLPRWVSAWLGSYVKALLAATGLLILALATIIHVFRRKNHDLPTMYLKTMKELEKKSVLRSVHPWHEMNTAEIVEKCPNAGDALAQFMTTYLRARFGSTGETSSYHDIEKARQELLHSVKMAGY